MHFIARQEKKEEDQQNWHYLFANKLISSLHNIMRIGIFTLFVKALLITNYADNEDDRLTDVYLEEDS